MTTMSAPRALSAIRPGRMRGLAAFVDTCSWTERPGDYGPDTWLLTLLDERVRWLEAERHGHTHGTIIRATDSAPELPAIGELPAEWIAPIVEDVKTRYPGWELAGGRGKSMRERLDEHFRRLQATKGLELADRLRHDHEQARRREQAEGEAERRAIDNVRALYGLDHHQR